MPTCIISMNSGDRPAATRAILLGGVKVSQDHLEDFQSRHRTDKVQQAIQSD
jgi:hypothetical protein